MSFRVSTAFASVTLSVLLAGCSQSKPGPPPRYAFLSFENISGDASLDWVTRGASEFLSRSLRDAMGGVGNVLSPDAVGRAAQPLGQRTPHAPGNSAARAAALGAGASHIVSGYLERTAAGVRVTASEEDVPTHRTVRTLSATAASPFEALTQLAHQFSPQSGPAATTNAEALRLFCTATLGTGSDAIALLEKAVELDPGFGRAWAALARTFIAAGNRDGAVEAIRKARTQKLAPNDLALLNLEEAALSGDRAASLAAMRKVSESDPGDTGLARSLAVAETNAGNFSQAAAVWKRLTVHTPEDVDAWNQLGYSLCWSGDYAGALAALREYARLRPNDANPLDSLGDVHYWFGKFTDAAASYSAAQAKTPDFLNGGEFYKAAWAKFRAGDKTGADALFAKFRDARGKNQEASADVLAGDWLYRTGRARDARTLLEESLKKELVTKQPALRAGIAAQLALWDLLAGDRATAITDLTSAGISDVTTAILRIAASPSATPAEWEARAERMLAAPQLAAIRASALGYALILDGKKQAAIPVWEKIVSQSSGADFFPRQLLTRLKNQPVEHLSPPDSINMNPFAAVLDKL